MCGHHAMRNTCCKNCVNLLVAVRCSVVLPINGYQLQLLQGLAVIYWSTARMYLKNSSKVYFKYTTSLLIHCNMGR